MKNVVARGRPTNHNKLTSKAAVTADTETNALSHRKEIVMTKPLGKQLTEMTPDEIKVEFVRVFAGIISGKISNSEAIEHAVAWKQCDKWIEDQVDAEWEMHREISDR